MNEEIETIDKISSTKQSYFCYSDGGIHGKINFIHLSKSTHLWSQKGPILLYFLPYFKTWKSGNVEFVRTLSDVLRFL